MKEQKLFRRYGVSLALATVGGFLEAYTYVTRDGVFASTMCTGNLRIATEHLNRYFSDKSRKELDTALQYYGIDLVFACAVLVGYWVTSAFGVRAVWFPILIPAALLILLRREEVR